MQNKSESSSLSSSYIMTSILILFLLAIALGIYILLPNNSNTVTPEQNAIITQIIEETEEEEFTFPEFFSEVSLERLADESDTGLALYRQPLSRSAVEWFYFQICGDRDVAQAILVEADNNDIPLSLAFSLAHTESNYNTNAVNKNSNTTVDRGLFQLNSNSFPALSEADFFDPFVSSKYGMSHLKFCLNSAGNEVSALAMYNAGTGRVRSNKTPQTTLNYVGKIIAYQKILDQLFAEQVVAYFEPQISAGIAVAYTK
ncbi:MAG: transglycosylase SLT domain-containing protein [Spirochaetales bacterium]|nr:transglycosylase SLT domain-containing protein [Spirochaetales bacterium]